MDQVRTLTLDGNGYGNGYGYGDGYGNGYGNGYGYGTINKNSRLRRQ